MELLTNGGAELAAPPPELRGDAIRTSAIARTGSWCFQLVELGGLGAPRIWWDFTPALGETVTPVFWAQTQLATGNLRVDLDKGNGNTITAWASLVPLSAGSEWNQYALASFSALGTAARITFLANAESFAKGWFLDDVSASVSAMGKTRTIRDALLLDFADITAGNGFDTTVARVYAEPVELEKQELPAVTMVPDEGGDTDDSERTLRSGQVVQFFRARIAIEHATAPLDAIQDFIDDTRNAIERSTSNVCALAGVLTADVTGWELTHLTSRGGDNYRAVAEVDIEVAYGYVRGSL